MSPGSESRSSGTENTLMPRAATTTGAHLGVQRRTATARRTSRPMSSLPLLSLVTMFTGSRW